MVQPFSWRFQLLRSFVCVLWNKAYVNHTSPAKPVRLVPEPAKENICIGGFWWMLVRMPWELAVGWDPLLIPKVHRLWATP